MGDTAIMSYHTLETSTVFLTAVSNLIGGAKFHLIGDDKYENIVAWNIPENEIPTKEQVMAEVARLEKYIIDTEYQRNRKPEYPSLEEFADAYYWEKKGDSSKMSAYVAKVDAVKSKYPKS
jgi:hypothetical protein